jgi:hypothetical protein
VAYTNPQPSSFKSYFIRDFSYGTNINTSVTDTDIANAMQMTNININQANWADQSSYNVGYLLLSAHYLVLNLRSSSQGINGQFSFLEQSKGVGAANQSFAIPQRILDNPLWSIFAKTNYGLQYLELLLPQLCGQIFTVIGTTLP